MAYTVLARRYRSTTFDEVVGQAHIAQTVKRAITSGRIAHAYLFCGTRGTGKTSMARILAKALNCQASEGPTPEPCGKCNSCLGIARGDDMDYVEIDAASNTGVDSVRDVIINNAAYRPARCRFKIFLIDEVHMLSKSAFNALLKTLEEPPEHVKFILATTEAEKIPNTVLSRCQRYDFRNISSREVAGHLGKICKDEGIDAADNALLMVARAGGGSMRDSLSLLDRLLSVGEKTLTIETIEQLLGLPRGEAVAGMVTAIGNGDAGTTLKLADDILVSGMSPDSLIAGLIDHLHNLLLIRVCGEKTELVEAPGVPPELLVEQSRKIDSVLLTQDIAVLEELRRQLRSGAGGRALMDATLVRLALSEQFRSISELMGDVPESVQVEGGGGAEKKKFESGVGQGGNAPAEFSRPSPIPTAAAPIPRTIVPPAASVPPAVQVEPPVRASTDEDDDLPRPGKVWDNSGPSLAEMLKQRQTSVTGQPAPGESDSSETAPPVEAVTNVEVVTNVEFVDEAKLPQVWQEVLRSFERSNPSLRGVLNETRLGSVDSTTATVHFGADRKFFAKMLEKDGRREKVASALSAAMGQQVGVKVVVEAEEEAIAVAEVAPRERIVKPSLADIEAMSRDAAPLAVVAANGSPTAAAPAGPAVVRVTDELKAELMQDDLISAIVNTLGGQIVRVTEE